MEIQSISCSTFWRSPRSNSVNRLEIHLAVVENRDVIDEELITMLPGLESLLNSRPLAYQSLDRRQDVSFTPYHFLHGQMGGKFAPESVETTTFNLRQRW